MHLIKMHLMSYMWGRQLDNSGIRGRWRKQALSAAAITLSAVLLMPLTAPADVPSLGLNAGFRRLYDLDFGGAQKDFETWEKQNPADPMGPVSEAAGILFSEFNRLGVLEAQFYEEDSVFSARKKYEADPAQRSRFEQQLGRAE